jgi:hypothetical protein
VAKTAGVSGVVHSSGRILPSAGSVARTRSFEVRSETPTARVQDDIYIIGAVIEHVTQTAAVVVVRANRDPREIQVAFATIMKDVVPRAGRRALFYFV